MKDRKAATRFARLLFDGAVKAGAVDAVQADLAALQALIAQSKEFAAFLGNQLIPQDRRRAILTSLLKDSLHAFTFRFIELMERERQLPMLAAVAAAFADTYRAAKGILKITVTSARPLEAAQAAKVREKIAGRLRKTVESIEKTDAKLLGGFRVQVNDMMFDFSLSRQLERLRAKMIQAT